MIFEGLIDFGVGIIEFFLGLLPDRTVGSWVDDGSEYLAQIWTSGAGLGAWVPWALLATVTTAVGACLLVGFGIKVVRLVLSLFTGGGGSAA